MLQSIPFQSTSTLTGQVPTFSATARASEPKFGAQLVHHCLQMSDRAQPTVSQVIENAPILVSKNRAGKLAGHIQPLCPLSGVWFQQ
jgi:hypothetical protein